MMEWLTALTGENTAQIIKFIGLFVLFLAVIYAVYLLIKRLTGGTYVERSHMQGPRLSVTDAAAVDSQRRLVLVRRDNVEHLILIGGPTDIVIEQNIRLHAESDAMTANTSSLMHQAQPVYADLPANTGSFQAERTQSQQTQMDADFTDFLTQDAVTSHQTVQAAAGTGIAREPQIDAAMRAVSASAAAAGLSEQTSNHTLQTHAQQVAAAARQQASQSPRAPAPKPADPVEAAPKLHPAYPLGQVARGVIAATSGLAAANNAAQQEMIAAAMRDKPNSTARPAPLQPSTALPSLATPQAIQPSVAAAPQAVKPAVSPAPSLDSVRPGEVARSTAQASQPAQILTAQRANAQAQAQAQQAEKREPNFTTSSAAPVGNAIGTTVQRSVSVTQTVTQVTTDLDANDFALDLETAVSEALAADSERSFEDMLSSEMDLQFNEPATPVQNSGMLDIPARK